MIETLRGSLQAAMEEAKRYSGLINWEDINEAVFRFLVMVEIRKLEPSAKCQAEWKTYDLVVTTEKGSFVIEFKFYGYPRRYNVTSMQAEGRKGGPSKKNEGEFRRCLNKLRNPKPPIDVPIAGKYLVLVYELRPGDWKGHNSYETSYADLALVEDFGVTAADVETIQHSDTGHVCKLITVG